MGRRYQTLIKLYSVDGNQFYPGRTDGDLDIRIYRDYVEYCRNVIDSIVSYHGGPISFSEKLDPISACIYTSLGEFFVKIDENPAPFRKRDLLRLICNPKKNSWFVNSIEIEGYSFLNFEDSTDFMDYLIRNNMELPSCSFVNSNFRTAEKEDSIYWKRTIHMRKEMIASGEFPASKLYKYYLKST